MPAVTHSDSLLAYNQITENQTIGDGGMRMKGPVRLRILRTTRLITRMRETLRPDGGGAWWYASRFMT